MRIIHKYLICICFLFFTSKVYCKKNNYYCDFFLHYDGAYFFNNYKYKTNYLPAFLGCSLKYKFNRNSNYKFKIDLGYIYCNYRIEKYGIWKRGTSKNNENSYLEKRYSYVSSGCEYLLKCFNWIDCFINGGIIFRPNSDNLLLVSRNSSIGEITVEHLNYDNTIGIFGGANVQIPIISHFSTIVNISYCRYFNNEKYRSSSTGQYISDPQKNTLLTQIGLAYSFKKQK